jgi:hypothetical protein
MKKRILIFGDAFGAIDFTLYFIHNNIDKYDCCALILFEKINYLKFANELNDSFWNNKLNVVYIKGFTPLKGKKIYKFINIINEFIYLKRIFKQYFKDIENTKIIFTVRKYRIDIFHFISKLSVGKGNKIYLCDADQTTLNIKNFPKTLKEIFYYCKSLIIYDKNLIFRREGENIFLQISDLFIKNNHISLIERASVENKVIELYDQYVNEFQIINRPKKIIFFDQYFEKIPSIIIDDLITNTFKILYKYYRREDIGFKYHPTQIGCNAILENFCEQIPTYIPGEFLLSRSNHFIISFSSNTLAVNNHSISISLLDLLDLSSDENRFLKNYLESKKKNEIHYIKNFKDLSDIIKNLN